MVRITKLFWQVLHSLLFAIFPILALYAANVDQTDLNSVGTALSISIFATLLSLFVLGLLFRNLQKSALFTTLLLISFFFYGHLHALISDMLDEAFGHFSELVFLNISHKFDRYLHLPMLLLLGLILGRVAILVWRSSHESTKLATSGKILTTTSLCLIVMPLSQVLWYYAVKDKGSEDPHKVETVALKEKNLTSRLGYNPDVYYIILDGYARADVLQQYYGQSNSDFLGFLKERGFKILEQAMSNYAYTFLSLPSSLNMQYLDDLAKRMGETSTDLRIPYQLIRDNKVARLFKSLGYSIVHLKSSWSGTARSSNSDIEIGYDYGMFEDEFLRILARTTLLKMFELTMVKDLASSHLASFEKLSLVPKLSGPEIQGPKFVFAHILMPHHPFIFDAEGRVQKQVDLSDSFQEDGWDNRSEYLEQLLFVNKKMVEVVGRILADSRQPPIVIIQSDHGPKISLSGERRGSSDSAFFDESVQARMAILLACYFPGSDESLLHQSITPVNLFRTVFSFYYGIDLPQLKDVGYFSTFNRPYSFIRELDQVPLISGESSANNNEEKEDEKN